MFVAVAFRDDSYIGKIKKVYKKRLQSPILRKCERTMNNVAVFRELNDGEKEVSEADKVFVIDADLEIVMKTTPDFRFEIPPLPEIVKHYKAYHKHYFAED